MPERAPERIVQLSTETIRTGSRSFAWASRVFSKEQRVASHVLYLWCRHCDDAIDHAPAGQPALEAWERIRDQTRQALAGNVEGAPPAFEAISWIARRFRVPDRHFDEFLEGMRMDLVDHRYRDEAHLRDYCYGVAGVIGVMMTYIMAERAEQTDASVLECAAEMGRAMQMTNIARDVKEDFGLGRVYLPQTWLAAEGVNAARLLDADQRPGLVRTVGRLLDVADDLYARGFRGVAALPRRSGLTIAVAAEVYRDIGRVVRRRGAEAWTERCVTRGSDKLRASVRGWKKWRLTKGEWQWDQAYKERALERPTTASSEM